MHDMHDGMGVWMALSGLIGLALLIALILAIIWLVRSLLTSGDRDRPHQDEAEAILCRRYAAGEIDEDEHERRRATLRRPPPTA